jgi:probable F420-dependent oxidoreductase
MTIEPLVRRDGLTVPLPGALATHEAGLRELADLGYQDLWSAESDGADAFTPLAMAAAWEPRLRLGTAIAPAFTRGPATLAQTVASMASAAPGRFVIGIGASSNVIVERWNDIEFSEPFRRVRDVVRFLHHALTGEKVTRTYDTFEVNGFRLGLVPDVLPKIMVAALRPGMLALAGRESDGAIVNWLSAADVTRVASIVNAEGDGKELVARIFVCPSTDADAVRAGARFLMAAYLNVAVYAEFHRWLGNAHYLQPMWDAWAAGDRKAALVAIPDEFIDQLVIWGTPGQCRAGIDRYFANGVTTSSLALMPLAPFDYWDAVRALAPQLR